MFSCILRLVNAIKQIRTLDQWVLDINSKYLHIVKKVQMTLFHQVHHKRFVEGLGLKAHGLKLRLDAFTNLFISRNHYEC